MYLLVLRTSGALKTHRNTCIIKGHFSKAEGAGIQVTTCYKKKRFVDRTLSPFTKTKAIKKKRSWNHCPLIYKKAHKTNVRIQWRIQNPNKHLRWSFL